MACRLVAFRGASAISSTGANFQHIAARATLSSAATGCRRMYSSGSSIVHESGNDSVNLKVNSVGFATVTLTNPKHHNAMSQAVIDGLDQCFRTVREMAEKHELRGVFFTGEGKSFCAGADLNWMKQGALNSKEQNYEAAVNFSKMLNQIARVPVPVVGLINGAGIGGGAGLVCVCDIAVGVKTAKFGYSEVRLGITPATISPYVIGAIGKRNATRFFLTGERFGADVAEKIGMLHEVADSPADLQSVRERYEAELLQVSPSAAGAAKELIYTVYNRPIEMDVVKDTARLLADVRATPDGKEGVSSFLEKRPAKWCP
eukprot:Clim_evm10s60 gene=Clim_evmTU10s60